MRRVFVEKKEGFRHEAASVLQDIRECLHVPALSGLRVVQRYDVEGLDDDARAWEAALRGVFAEPPVDDVFVGEALPLGADEVAFAVEFLPGQFDQRADSAAQCVQILTCGERPRIASARVFVLRGNLAPGDVARIRDYLINPVDSREASLAMPVALAAVAREVEPVPCLDNFNGADAVALRAELGLAMSPADVLCCQRYFREVERRAPTLTEIRVLDTYWSDHCRHTTFLTRLEQVDFADSPAVAPLREAWELYLRTRRELGREARDVCLMDLATLAARALKNRGALDDLEESEEINAASIVVNVDRQRPGAGASGEEWLVMFKNETHNHPTEIEPFGGAATCLGGAIRDPLSGRSYVYQAMRVTGAADPRTPFGETLPGKLPQRKITRGAAHGYSSYGNQIGLATGLVAEVYHPGFVAKRMEIGAVVAACPRENVVRGTPAPGDVVVLAGGRTGRDGIGGATGSSKEHTETALQNSAEVQKGDAPTERKLQRLFRDPAVARLIKRCNDFGAGGVSVAIGELAPGLDIALDAVPLKYDGLNGTELAISESQERMAVVLAPADVEKFRAAAARENIETAVVAHVTGTGRLRMSWRGQEIVNLRRDFLDTNGAKQSARARVEPFPAAAPKTDATSADFAQARARYTACLSQLNVCSQRGLGERFDASIGAATVLHPFGGKHQVTPIEAMAAKLPVPDGDTDTCTLMSHGYNPAAAHPTPGHGAILAIVEAVTRITAAGGNPARIRLTLQEYFEKLGADPARWGKPLAALLGAFKAQMELGVPAIGGKDSMSGTFKELDVPPTLVAFAIVPAKASLVLSPEFKKPGSTLLLLPAPIDSRTGLPALPLLRQQLADLHELHATSPERILAARSIRQGGLGAALAEMAFGNGIGAQLTHPAHTPGRKSFFTPAYGSLILEIADTPAGEKLTQTLFAWPTPALPIGHTTAEPHIAWATDGDKHSLPLRELQTAWESPLESTFPTRISM